MDPTNPVRSVVPTVDADVLQVLARTHLGLTGARVADLAGRSYAQVRATLHRLVRVGLVDGVRHGRAVSYTLNRDHVAAPAVELLCAGPEAVEQRITEAVTGWASPGVAVAAYGSWARRDGGPDSDIDLLVVRPDQLDPDDALWATQRYALARDIERWSGNVVQILELSARELADATRANDDLVVGLRRDAVVLAGPPRELLFGPEPTR